MNKLDCIGHVQKRVGENLRNMAKGSKPSDGKPVGDRSGRLINPTINLLQKYYGNAIRKNIDRAAKTKSEIDTIITNMQDIKTTLYQSVKLPNEEERHQFCPKETTSWGLYQKAKANGQTTNFQNENHHLDPTFLEFLLPLFTRLIDPKLLRRCVPGYSQNFNETVKGMVWNKCPKHM